MSFTCPICKMTSHHPDDEKFGWCGNCEAFTAPGRILTDVRAKPDEGETGPDDSYFQSLP